MTIADDVLPAEIDEPAVPVELDRLLPWHRPRKQLVRENQWIRLSRQLIKGERGRSRPSVQNRVETEVRYLTLPGIDYIDVRQLADVCREFDCSLTTTGFHPGEERNPRVARAKLREKALIDAGHISHRSHTFARRFEDISDTGSDAYRDIKRRLPFDIVNVDACGPLAPSPAGHARRLVEAVYRMVELQFQFMTGRWLLFVTTDVRRESIARQTLDKFRSVIFKNADTNDNFRHVAGLLFGAGAVDIRAAVQAASERTDLVFLKLFSLGLAKWLLHLAREKMWDMETHDSYCYSTRPENDARPSMACLAFEFLPPAPGLEDPFAVVRVPPAPSPERGDTSVRAAEKVRDMADADERIASDSELRRRMTQILRECLEEAGYGAEALARLEALGA